MMQKKSNSCRTGETPVLEENNNALVEYKTSGWALSSTKRRIIFTDKKSIGEVKLLGKWDIQTYPVKLIKRKF